MSGLIIPQRSIWLCELDTNGRLNNCQDKCKRHKLKKEDLRGNPPHFFLVISKKNNEDFVTALPISSKRYQIEKNEANFF